MDRVIYKYPITNGQASYELPCTSRVLHVGEQDGELFVWVDRPGPNQFVIDLTHYFYVVGTGWAVPYGTYVGTVQMDAGHVWHVYTEREE